MESTENSDIMGKINKLKKMIIDFLIKYKSIIIRNTTSLILLVVICVLIYLAYNFSKKKRIGDKLHYLNNVLVYDKPREQIDFCGIDNNIRDVLYCSAKFDTINNTIEIVGTTNIDLFNIGLSSEYFLDLKKTDLPLDNATGDKYRIKKLESSTKIQLTDDKKLEKIKNADIVKINSKKDDKITDPSPKVGYATKFTINNIEIVYHKPSSNLNKYKHSKLSDYFICSSYRSFLVGNQMSDYSSVDMIMKCLYYGARYIELEIFDRDNSPESVPMVGVGYNDGKTNVGLNNLLLEDCVNKIKEFAFSRKFLDNYNDPLFIFLNLKTTNTSTLDKVHHLFSNNLRSFLLSKKYNHINMSTVNLCELKRKCVLFCSPGYEKSKLNGIINSATNRGNLKRMTYSKAIEDINKFKGVKFRIQSNSVRFIPSIDDYIEIMDDKFNFKNYNVKAGDTVQISGADNARNNTGDMMYRIIQVTKNKIVFDKNVEFMREDVGASIILKGYDKNMNMDTHEEYNKNNISIVVPDNLFWSHNYNYHNVFYTGAQFVCMNFQTIDTNMISYFNYFKKRSFITKPRQLIGALYIPKTPSLNSMVPKLDDNLVVDIDYSFLDKDKQNVNIVPFKNSKTKLINDNRIARLSLNHGLTNSQFTVVLGLNKQRGYVSFKDSADRYLCYNEGCCYLYFNRLTAPDLENKENTYINSLKQYASFLPLNPLISEKGYNSFGVIRNKSIDGKNKDILYYLRARNELSTRDKLYHKNTTKYEVKSIINTNEDELEKMDSFLVEKSTNYKSGIIVILRPKKSKDFYPAGDIAVPLSRLDLLKKSVSPPALAFFNGIVNPNQKISTKIFAGAVDKPMDYELVWDNKYMKEATTQATTQTTNTSKSLVNYGKELSIWKPIPNDGFTAMGVVFVEGYRKPSINDIVCVSNEYLSEQNIMEDTLPLFYLTDKPLSAIKDRKDTSNPGLILWKNSTHSYVQPLTSINFGSDISKLNPVIPNPIGFRMWDFITEEKDYSDRLYLDSEVYNKKNKLDCLFKVNTFDTKKESGGTIYDYLMKIENSDGKLISYTKSLNGGNMCMALPQPYWSSFYSEITAEPGVSGPPNPTNDATTDKLQELKFESCRDREYFGTNWKYYNDKSIRLEGNNKYCVTYNTNDKDEISTDIDDTNNFLYLTKCEGELNNQKFLYENKNLKVFTDTPDSPNACITHTPSDGLRLEECGDRKYTALWKWNNEINREDKCSKGDAEDVLERVGSMEDCSNMSYYVVYLKSEVSVHDEEFCDYSEALKKYNEYEKKYKLGVAIIHNGVIKKRSTKENKVNLILDNYTRELKSRMGECVTCVKASKILCSENNTIKSSQSHYENVDDKRDLGEYCAKLKNNTSFKCSRQYRQNFINNLLPDDYCLAHYKEVYLYVNPSNIDHYSTLPSNIKLGRPTTSSKYPVDNLLGEEYDTNGYHIFIKGVLGPSSDKNKYKISFDKNLAEPSLNNTSIDIDKISSDIILDYVPDYNSIKVGDKVLATNNVNVNEKHAFQFGNIQLKQEYIKWMAVVIKKLKNNRVKIMFSINSYDPFNKNTKINLRPHELTNPVKIVDVSEIVLLKKAPICI